MKPRFTLEGFAIVSADDRIADASGAIPKGLRNRADWIYFQTWLDKSAVTLLGRRSHDVAPNPKGRLRLILSRSLDGLERRPDGWWWNPAGMALDEALSRIAPQGGLIAVPGGQDVFDLIGPGGFDAFHLARAHACALPDGRGLFAACETGTTADSLLAAGGMAAGPVQWLDEAARVSLTVWKKPG